MTTLVRQAPTRTTRAPGRHKPSATSRLTTLNLRFIGDSSPPGSVERAWGETVPRRDAHSPGSSPTPPFSCRPWSARDNEEVGEVQIVPEGGRTAPGARVGFGPGLCGFPRTPIPGDW